MANEPIDARSNDRVILRDSYVNGEAFSQCQDCGPSKRKAGDDSHESEQRTEARCLVYVADALKSDRDTGRDGDQYDEP